jgi:hypothetical protein
VRRQRLVTLTAAWGAWRDAVLAALRQEGRKEAAAAALAADWLAYRALKVGAGARFCCLSCAASMVG